MLLAATYYAKVRQPRSLEQFEGRTHVAVSILSGVHGCYDGRADPLLVHGLSRKDIWWLFTKKPPARAEGRFPRDL